MRNITILIVVALIYIFLSGCVLLHEAPWYGSLYTEHRAMASTRMFMVENPLSSEKRGENCSQVIVGFPMGKATVINAVRAAGIQRIHSIGYSFYWLLNGIYGEYCIIVRGE